MDCHKCGKSVELMREYKCIDCWRSEAKLYEEQFKRDFNKCSKCNQERMERETLVEGK